MDTMIKKTFNKQDGLTVLELMVAISLLGIVLALGYMYFSYGVQAFDRGERRTIAQSAARLTSDFITSELRFAKEIEINPAENPGDSSGYCYIYEESNSIKFMDENGNIRILADSNADDMLFSILFTSHVPDDVVIFYFFSDLDIDLNSITYNSVLELKDKVEALADDGLYFLKTKVQALNLKLFRELSPGGDLIELNNYGGSLIKYKKP